MLVSTHLDISNTLYKLRRDVVDGGLNLVQPRLSRSKYSAYIALTSGKLAKNID